MSIAACKGTVSALVGTGVLLLSLLGILSRPHLDLATFWPANAFMLGMLVRFPNLANLQTWFACAAGFFLADAITGAALLGNIVLNGGNLAAIWAGYSVFAALPAEDRMLKRPTSIFQFLRAVLAASLVAGVFGTVANPLLFGGSPMEGFFFWLATELVNYTAFLPMFLTLPPLAAIRPDGHRRRFSTIRWRRALPLLALAVSAACAAMVGGPGAVAFPVPALLWCALTYNLFLTSCLAFAFGAWTLLAIRTGIMSVGPELETRALLISARIGVTLIALAPIVVGIVIASRNELLEKLRFLADHDPMTGLRNRRAFLEAGAEALKTSLDRKEYAAVMMLDIDHFKSINDRHGHEAGDRVLSAFAEALERNLRPRDTLGRIGGEEFAVVLPNCGLQEAASVAERINNTLRETGIALANGETIAVTVSIGIHVEHREHALDRLLAHADTALYQAKNAGRDRFALSAGTRLLARG